ncbi:Para-nitrobenzyl esterase [Colletotrichum tanaceti]|nr:Para-nitrobenzyl esterase [Colletotrichum tanaceti]
MGIVNMFPTAAGIVLAAACLSSVTAASACNNNSSSSSSNSTRAAVPSAVLPQGTIRGFRDASCNSVFLGVPFAGTTGGGNRWRPPQDLPRSNRTFAATSYGPTCPQAISGDLFSQQGEDCLNLNIWAPSTGGENLPVFVYMYGGAMVTGSSSNPHIQGSNFARKGVVYVNFNTRESVFASPHSAELTEEAAGTAGTAGAAGAARGSQNFGILDVEKALDWVRENIRAFGGDPEHVVFGGHSSGGVHVDHYLWNHPDSWLKGAVQMSANAVSGPAFAPVNPEFSSI